MNPAENYILNKSEPFRSILMHLQSVIEHTITAVDLKYKYRIPFYYVDGKPFCYLNQSKNYIDLGLWQGNQITVHQEHLIAGRKVIRSLRYSSLEEVNDAILIEILKDAYAVRGGRFNK
jgi:hypothetical protein